jgi:uncharacterized peroxidase-related enzyme
MLRLTPVEPEQSCKELKRIPDKFHPNAKETSNFFRVLARSSAALNAYLRSEKALADGRLTPRQREQIALTVAEINGSKYCLAAHNAISRRMGLSDEEIRLARKASASDPKAEAMLHFVRAIVIQRGEISDADFGALRKAGFSEAEATEILANIVLNIFSNYFNLMASTEVDFPAAPQIDAQHYTRQNPSEEKPVKTKSSNVTKAAILAVLLLAGSSLRALTQTDTLASSQIQSIDRTNMSITVKQRGRDETVTLYITSETRFFKNGQPAITSDLKAGDEVSGLVRKNSEGKVEAVRIQIRNP